MLRFAFVVVLVMFLPTSNASSENELPAATKVLATSMSIENKYMNLFPSLRKYLAAQEELGVMTPAEHKDLESFLIKQGVDLNRQIPAAQVKGRKFVWEKYTLELMKNGDLKLPSGRLLRFEKSERFVEAFYRIFKAMTEKNIASAGSLLLPNAYAGTLTRATEAVGPTLATVTGWLVAAGVTPFAAYCGTVVIPVSFVKYAIQWMKWNKTVDCRSNGGVFRFLQYPSYNSTVDSDFRDFARHQPSLVAPAAGVTGALCGGPIGSLMGFNNKRTADAATQRIPRDFLKQALGSGYPACTTENEKKLEDFIDAKGEEALKILVDHNQVKDPNWPQKSEGTH